MVKLWNITTGQELLTFSGHVGEITTVAFSPDGSTIVSVFMFVCRHQSAMNTQASGSLNYGGLDVRLWDVATGQELLPQLENALTSGPMIYSVAFSPDGETVVFMHNSKLPSSCTYTENMHIRFISVAWITYVGEEV